MYRKSWVGWSVGFRPRGLPSTSMRSATGLARTPICVTTSPFTRTRPAAISSSAARREATPAFASIFCNRSEDFSGPVGTPVLGLGVRCRATLGLGLRAVGLFIIWSGGGGFHATGQDHTGDTQSVQLFH